MILKHIVMMKLKANDLPIMLENLKQLENGLNDLLNHISVIEAWEVGINFSDRSTAMDLVLVSGFANEESLEKYKVHPKHLEVLSFIKKVIEEIRVVDYWV